MFNIKKIFKGSKKKINPIIITIASLLILVIIGAIAYKFRLISKKSNHEIQTLDELLKRLDKSMAYIRDKNEGINLGMKLEDSYTLDQGDDLTTDLLLTGILWNIQTPFAIINDHILMAGDQIEGFRIVTIDKESITLRDKSGNDKIKKLYEK